MKRTPLQRSAPPKQRAQLRRTAAVRKRRAGKRRESAWRSPKYLAWVKTLCCVMCGAPADDAHHIIGTGNHGGMGTKAGDGLVMPMCRHHHGKIHRTPELWHRQQGWVEQTQRLAFIEGWELP